MEMGIAEMPLALFSTFAPMGAGAFAVLAAAFLTTSFDKDDLKRIDRMTLVPLCFLAFGFVASFFHLASPGNAFGVLSATGTSPLSNEILAGIVFFVAAVAYWIVAMAGKLGEGARKSFACVVAVLGIVFAAFTGAAYMIDTISSWNTALVPLEMIGFALVGGGAVGVMTLGFAGVQAKLDGRFGTSAMALLIVGAVLGIVLAIMQTTGVSGMQNYVMDGADVVSGVTMWMACGAVLVAAACVFGVMAARGKSMTTFGVTATILAVAGILVLRIVFYATEFSVGLAI